MSAPATKTDSKPNTDAIPASFTNGGANLLTTALAGSDWSGSDVADKIVAGLFSHERLRPITKKNPPQPHDKASADLYDDWEHAECTITTTEGEREMIRKCLKHESTAKKLPNWYHTAKLYVAFGLDKK